MAPRQTKPMLTPDAKVILQWDREKMKREERGRDGEHAFLWVYNYVGVNKLQYITVVGRGTRHIHQTLEKSVSRYEWAHSEKNVTFTRAIRSQTRKELVGGYTDFGWCMLSKEDEEKAKQFPPNPSPWWVRMCNIIQNLHKLQLPSSFTIHQMKNPNHLITQIPGIFKLFCLSSTAGKSMGSQLWKCTEPPHTNDDQL